MPLGRVARSIVGDPSSSAGPPVSEAEEPRHPTERARDATTCEKGAFLGVPDGERGAPERTATLDEVL